MHRRPALHAHLPSAGARILPTLQEQQVIELVTSLLAQDKVSPEQAANILQQMLPPDTLSQLQVGGEGWEVHLE